MFLGVLCLAISPAMALKFFQTSFEARYAKRSEADSKEIARNKVMLAQAIEEVKCNVCHNGRDKKRLNVYGNELAKLLDKKADAENTKKVIHVMEEVGKAKSDPRDEKSPTFGDLIRRGRLPAQTPQ